METQPAGWRAPDLTVNGTKVLEKRYLKRDENGLLETPGGRFYNVARAVAQAYPESMRDGYTYAFYKMMANCEFMPNSPTLMNAGKGNGLQLSACFVLPVEDTMEGIFETVKRTALVHKSGGGTGFSFSRLRPSGDFVGSTGGVASGPISFMTVINETTEEVKQGGTRRGANMGILRVDHPDILRFVSCKSVLSVRNQNAFDSAARYLSEEGKEALKKGLLEGQIANFNISVAITSEFMRALRNDTTYALIDPRTKAETDRLSAREVWETLVKSAWASGDPGLIFIDRINSGPANPVPSVGPVESTNPCGEQPLYPNEACNLGSINLGKFYLRGSIDWYYLSQVVRESVHFLDGVISVNPYPDATIDHCVKENRRIGLGVMGWADLLIQLGIPYASEAAVELGSRVMEFINDEACKASQGLAWSYGPFENFEISIYKGGPPRRNSTVTTVAPTGTISIIAGCSSGIEPLFALCFDRSGSLDGVLDVETYPELERLGRLYGWWSDNIARHILATGSIVGHPDVPEVWQRIFATAHDIPLDYHVRMQAAFQKHVENAVSKTINLTHLARVEDVDKAYRMAYETGCMGITVYRDGSKVGVLHSGVKKESCPNCGENVVHEEGCSKCFNCGWSACSV